MNLITIDESRCTKNHVCPVIRICPSGAVSQKSPFSAPDIDKLKCTECGLCSDFCGYKAFKRI
jgi:ferredoxin